MEVLLLPEAVVGAVEREEVRRLSVAVPLLPLVQVLIVHLHKTIKRELTTQNGENNILPFHAMKLGTTINRTSPAKVMEVSL